jgi:hypothetical protein
VSSSIPGCAAPLAAKVGHRHRHIPSCSPPRSEVRRCHCLIHRLQHRTPHLPSPLPLAQLLHVVTFAKRRRGERPPYSLRLASGHLHHRRTSVCLLPCPVFSVGTDRIWWRWPSCTVRISPVAGGNALISSGWRLGSHNALGSAATANASS